MGKRPNIILGLPLQDQRSLHGAALHATVADVEAFWRAVARTNGFRMQPPPEGSPFPCGREIVETGIVARAYVSDNRWCADCQVCGGGMAAWSENPRALCLDCGSLHEIVFPEPDTMAEAVSVLQARLPVSRHWDPAFETPIDLAVQNIGAGDATGVVDVPADMLPPSPDDPVIEVAPAEALPPER